MQKYDNDIFKYALIKARSQNAPGIDNVEYARKALHEEIEMKCFYEGNSTLLIGDNLVEVEAGDVVVMNPYELHATLHQGTVPGKYYIIMISPDFFQANGCYELDLKNLLFTKHMRFQTLFKNNRTLCDVFEKIVKETEEQKPYYKVTVTGLIFELFTYIIREGMHKDENPKNSSAFTTYSSIEPALRYIRDYYSQPLKMDDLVAQCNICKQYFCRVFKNVTGKTAMEYLRDYRLQVANTLIINTDKNMMKIAEMCGFPSENYFVRCYKKYYGISPGMRRKTR
ncbi:MAG: helix-turn-helix transcriptional regulator [Oscillospiraceae bacterium]|nr:helix-turn-helix transcriptional regulator [Candidatus Equicaccousia limihippi]